MRAMDQCESPSHTTAIQRELRKLGELAEALAPSPGQGLGPAQGEKPARNLMKFYAACERILSLMNREAKRRFERGVSWQSRSLLETEVERGSVSLPVLSVANRRLLQKLLAFRNLQHSIYGYVPAPYVIAKLSELVILQQAQLVEEFERLWVFLLAQPARHVPLEKQTNTPSAGFGFVLPNA